MWQLKIRVREKWNIYNSRTIKFGINLYVYSHNNYEEGGKLFFIALGIADGDKKQINKFFRDLKKDSKVKYLEWKDNFFICIYSEVKTAKRAKAVIIAYNPKLIFLKPTIIDKEGWEEWEVASIDRKALEAFLEQSERSGLEYNIIYFNEKKLENIMVYSIAPLLTKKQKQAIFLALKEGYYGYPRGITLEKLAKISKLSVSTFQFHIARAEAKLMPFAVKRA